VPPADVVDALWGEAPPASAPLRAHALVTQLGRCLHRAGTAGDCLRVEPRGYRLLVAGEPDLRGFDRLVTDARQRAATRDFAGAESAYGRALALWRGPALADVTAPFAEFEAARLEEQRLTVVEERVDVELRLGRHERLAPELTRLVRRHPLRERMCGQLMLALYRCGRAGEALAAYRGLCEHVGSEPGQRLRQLYRAITVDHPSLQPPHPQIG
jgi:DNA-binding SARP family transcriptional activator